MPSINIWVPFIALMITIFVQTAVFAFHMGKQSETVTSLKRRIDSLEGKPVVNHEAKLATIDATLLSIQANMKASEERLDERFRSLEGTFRNMVQLATSPRSRRANDG